MFIFSLHFGVVVVVVVMGGKDWSSVMARPYVACSLARRHGKSEAVKPNYWIIYQNNQLTFPSVCFFFSRHISTLRPSPVSNGLHSHSVCVCDVESLQESLEGPPHDLRDWTTLFSFSLSLSLSLSLLSLWFLNFWLFREATHTEQSRLELVALITRWMRADWLIEIINTWQWWTSSSFQFLPFSFSSTHWNLDIWHSKRWKGSALNIQFRPFHQVQLVAVPIYWFRFVCTHLRISTLNMEMQSANKIGPGYLHFFIYFFAPLLRRVYLWRKRHDFFRLGIAPNRKQHESAQTRFFFTDQKREIVCCPYVDHFTYPILFRCKFFEGSQPAILLCVSWCFPFYQL